MELAPNSHLEQVTYAEWRMFYCQYLANYLSPRFHRSIVDDIKHRSFALATINCAIASIQKSLTLLIRLAHTCLTLGALPVLTSATGVLAVLSKAPILRLGYGPFQEQSYGLPGTKWSLFVSGCQKGSKQWLTQTCQHAIQTYDNVKSLGLHTMLTALSMLLSPLGGLQLIIRYIRDMRATPQLREERCLDDINQQIDLFKINNHHLLQDLLMEYKAKYSSLNDPTKSFFAKILHNLNQNWHSRTTWRYLVKVNNHILRARIDYYNHKVTPSGLNDSYRSQTNKAISDYNQLLQPYPCDQEELAELPELPSFRSN